MKTILLVDDDPIFHFLNSKIISLVSPSTIKSVNDGREALQALRDGFTPDYIFLDLDMPMMNGMQFINAFNAEPLPGKNKMTIVVLTSSETQEEQNMVNKLGVKYYVSKPLKEETLKELLG